MTFKRKILITFLIPILVFIPSNVKSENVKQPEIFINTPSSLTVFKGQSIELICLASTTNPNVTDFKWILPEVEQYMKEDRDKRIEEVKNDFGEMENIKIMKLKIPSIRYQDRGEYVCMGNYTSGNYSVIGRTFVFVEEHSGFAPAIWILIGFLLMTIVSIGVILLLEMKGISKAKEDTPINEVQF